MFGLKFSNFNFRKCIYGFSLLSGFSLFGLYLYKKYFNKSRKVIGEEVENYIKVH